MCAHTSHRAHSHLSSVSLAPYLIVLHPLSPFPSFSYLIPLSPPRHPFLIPYFSTWSDLCLNSSPLFQLHLTVKLSTETLSPRQIKTRKPPREFKTLCNMTNERHTMLSYFVCCSFSVFHLPSFLCTSTSPLLSPLSYVV